jgi:SAM-dependent methyltransferase
MIGLATATPISYAGRDLEAMDFAENYHRWILHLFSPYLGKRLVEVGAGTGSFSQLLLEQQPQSLALVEPSAEMYRLLVARLNQLPPTTDIKMHKALFTDAAEEIREQHGPDSIIYVNVLEHIQDDESELRAVLQTLAAGGRLFIFVPALHWLYGSFDRKIEHCRRYSKRELEEKCLVAGFKIIRSCYFDLFGVLPWWMKYCLLRSETMEPGAVRFYDRHCVPIARRFESIIRPPIGKNLLLIAEKP